MANEMLEMMKMMGGGDGKRIFDQFLTWRENQKSGTLIGPSAGKAQGKGAHKLAQGEKIYVGKIKTWDAEKQRGFIFCEDVFHDFGGQDVYVHQSVLEHCGGGLGDTVAFFLHVSPTTGNPQASAPMIRIASNDTFALKGIFKPSNDMKGHGFLQSKLVFEFFGRDCYVNKDMAALIPPGAMVAFNAHLNKDKMPNMDNNCEWVEDHWEPEPGELSISGTDELTEQRRMTLKGKASGKGKTMQNFVAQMLGSGEGAMNGMGKETYMGVVKSVTEGSMYGTISCEEVEKKYSVPCYFNCLSDDGRSASFGDIIEFDVVTDSGGNPQATRFRILQEEAKQLQQQQAQVQAQVDPLVQAQMEVQQAQAQSQAQQQPMEVDAATTPAP